MTIGNMSWHILNMMSQELASRVRCTGCDSKEVYIYFDKRYHGLRGFCPICKTNWPES